jgi:putative phosphoribosyl transferase
MSPQIKPKLVDRVELRNRTRVFRDREQAGEALAGMLETYRGSNALVLALPAGGVPVAAVVARSLGLPLDVLVVSKITLPWDTESGYGAVAFDGTVRLNKGIIAAVGLEQRQIDEGISEATRKVARRFARLRGDRPMPDLSERTAVVVDDGIASGFTLRVGVGVLHRMGVRELVVAVPTAHQEALHGLAEAVDAVYCPNVRSGYRFAVADAYEHWRDVPEEEAGGILTKYDLEAHRRGIEH